MSEISNLQKARAAYQPKLPKALQGPVKAIEGAATQSVGNQEEIKGLFPNTYGMPVVEFGEGTKASTSSIMTREGALAAAVSKVCSMFLDVS